MQETVQQAMARIKKREKKPNFMGGSGSWGGYKERNNSFRDLTGETHVMPDGTTMLNSDMTGAMPEAPPRTPPEITIESLSRPVNQETIESLSRPVNQETIESLSRPVDEPELVKAFIEGANSGLASFLALPSDVMNFAIDTTANAFGFDDLDLLPSGKDVYQDMKSLGATTGLDTDNLLPSEKVARVGGETFAAIAPLGVGVPGLAAKVLTKGPKLAEVFAKRNIPKNFVRNIFETAAVSPNKFAAIELSSGIGAAQGAMLAQLLRPDEMWPRIAGEVVFGIANPASLALRVASAVSSGTKRFASSFTGPGKERQAGEEIKRIIMDFGEDPEDVAQALLLRGGRKLPADVKSGSPALSALTKTLAKENSVFAAEQRNTVDEAQRQIGEAIDDLVATGKPENLVTAAKIRSKRITDVLDERISVAESRAAQTASKLNVKYKMSDLGKQTKKALEDALVDARVVEKSLWNKVNKAEIVDTKNLLDSTQIATEKYLMKNEAMPTLVQNELKYLLDNSATAGEMLKFRSRLLRMSRLSRSSADINAPEAAVFDELAAGILRDLDVIPGSAADEAREFTSILHDRFTRTFARNSNSSTATGAPRIPPEILLEKAFGSGGTTADLNLQALKNAAKFGDEAGKVLRPDMPLFGQQYGTDVADAQSRIIALMAKESLEDGVVNPQKLTRFMNKNSELLERFPLIKADLTDANSAQQLLKQVEAQSNFSKKVIASKAYFSKFAGVDNTAPVFNKMFNFTSGRFSGQNIEKNFNQIFKMASKGGKSAVEGFNASVFDWAWGKAGGDLTKLKTLMETPVRRNGPNLFDLMNKSGGSTRRSSGMFRKLLDEYSTTEKNFFQPRGADATAIEADAIFDFLSRVSGAQGASFASGGGRGGSGIIIAGSGSRESQRVLKKLPNVRIKEVMMKAMNDPKLAGLLIKKVNIKQRAALESQINAYLIQSGIISKEDQEP